MQFDSFSAYMEVEAFRSSLLAHLDIFGISSEDLAPHKITIWDPSRDIPETSYTWMPRRSLTPDEILELRARFYLAPEDEHRKEDSRHRRMGRGKTVEHLSRAANDGEVLSVWAMASLVGLISPGNRLRTNHLMVHDEKSKKRPSRLVRTLDGSKPEAYTLEAAVSLSALLGAYHQDTIHDFWKGHSGPALPATAPFIIPTEVGPRTPTDALETISGLIAATLGQHRPVILHWSPEPPEDHEEQASILSRSQEILSSNGGALGDDQDDVSEVDGGLDPGSPLMRRFQALPEKWRDRITPNAIDISTVSHHELLALYADLPVEPLSVMLGASSTKTRERVFKAQCKLRGVDPKTEKLRFENMRKSLKRVSIQTLSDIAMALQHQDALEMARLAELVSPKDIGRLFSVSADKVQKLAAKGKAQL